MATYSKVLSTTWNYSPLTDAGYRAYGLEISTALDAVGLSKTTDTGQVDWATATGIVYGFYGGNQWPHYEIRRLSSPAGSSPIILKFEYGVPGSYGYQYGLKISVGDATDGAGVINYASPLATSVNIFGATNSNSANTNFNVCRTDNGEFWFSLSGSTNNYGIFSLERRKNQTTGAAISDDYRLQYWSQSTGFTYINWQKNFGVPRSGGLTEGASLYWNGQPSPSGDVVLAPTYGCFPSLELMDSHLFYRSGEIGASTTFSATVFNSRTYLATGAQVTQANAQFAGVWE